MFVPYACVLQVSVTLNFSLGIEGNFKLIREQSYQQFIPQQPKNFTYQMSVQGKISVRFLPSCDGKHLIASCTPLTDDTSHWSLQCTSLINTGRHPHKHESLILAFLLHFTSLTLPHYPVTPESLQHLSALSSTRISSTLSPLPVGDHGMIHSLKCRLRPTRCILMLRLTFPDTQNAIAVPLHPSLSQLLSALSSTSPPPAPWASPPSPWSTHSSTRKPFKSPRPSSSSSWAAATSPCSAST